jgi:hypothetical protein
VGEFLCRFTIPRKRVVGGALSLKNLALKNCASSRHAPGIQRVLARGVRDIRFRGNKRIDQTNSPENSVSFRERRTRSDASCVDFYRPSESGWIGGLDDLVLDAAVFHLATLPTSELVSHLRQSV